VVLLGWSGGGSLSAFYQAQAEHPTVSHTPSGDGPSLIDAALTPANGVIQMAAHVSRHRLLTEWLDASIPDANDPDKRDPSLDLYGDEVKPPYDEAFLARYREAQIERNRRITAWVKEKLAELRATGRENQEFAFVTHGTMADPRWLDPAVDPSDRKAGWCYLGDPKVVNMSPVGLGRFSTLRSWLSQWSYDHANADGPTSLAKVTVPVLVISNAADNACAPSHARRLFDAVGHNDKEYYEVKGATHYYFEQRELGVEAVEVVKRWLSKHGFEA
jgi:pimeloyl-ACP methyl ester carboxylesterase